MRVDPHSGSPMNPQWVSINITLSAHPGMDLKSLLAVPPTEGGKGHRQGCDMGRVGENPVPVCTLKKIQVLLVPLLKALQQQFVLRPLQLQHADLLDVQSRSLCCPKDTAPIAAPGGSRHS